MDLHELLLRCAQAVATDDRRAAHELLDATVARDSAERMLVERDIFGAAAMNVIACEGGDRVERPEAYKQWQARNQRAGLKAAAAPARGC